MNDVVFEYAQAGFCLFPLKGKSGIQQGYDWTTTPYDPGLTRAHFPDNYGVVIGLDFLVIDIDVKKGRPGLASFEKLTKDAGLPLGWEETTYCVQTGSGGFHIYLRKPKDFPIRQNPKAYPGIDFLTGNHYVVGAGSLHPESGKEYLAIYRSPLQIAPSPVAILDCIHKKEIVELNPTPETVDDDPINIERFIETLANMPVVPQGNQRNSCYIAACRGRDLGLSLEVCCSILHTHYNGVKLDPPLQQHEVDDTAKNAYRYAQGTQGGKNIGAIFESAVVGEPLIISDVKWDRTEEGKLQKTLNNAVNHIATTSHIQETFRFNVFNQQIEICSKAPWYKERGSKGANLEDDDETLLRYYLARNFFIEYTETSIWDAITIVAKKRHYHPVQNYLNNLKWDGVPRLNTWLQTYLRVADSCYVQDVGRKVLCGAVKRIMQPGCKFDYVMILEGAQGGGKSTVVQILGKLWAGVIPNLDPHHADSISKMFGKWIIELSEMTSLKWADANALRAFFTNEKDTVRLPYGRLAKDFPRQSIFIGTVNPEAVGYLTDATGNRRYWIIPTPSSESNPIDFVGLEQVVDQLWAEAMTIYKTEALHLTGESQQIQKRLAESRMPEEPYKHQILLWEKQNPDVIEVQIVTILEFMGVPGKAQGKLDYARVGSAFSQLGWERHQRHSRGQNEVWYVKPLAQRIQRATELQDALPF